LEDATEAAKGAAATEVERAAAMAVATVAAMVVG